MKVNLVSGNEITTRQRQKEYAGKGFQNAGGQSKYEYNKVSCSLIFKPSNLINGHVYASTNPEGQQFFVV